MTNNKEILRLLNDTLTLVSDASDLLENTPIDPNKVGAYLEDIGICLEEAIHKVKG